MSYWNQVAQHFDLCIKVNNRKHHTDEITTKRLIVRRGQEFQISLHKSISFGSDINKGNITFVVSSGRQHHKYDTKTVFGLSRGNIRNEWKASVIYEDKVSLEVEIFPPADATIGLHHLGLELSNGYQIRHYSVGEFIILFNAWCPDDAVFLQDEEERKEYVMNENGIVFVGNADHISKFSWNFGQFDEDIVGICLKLLDENLQSPKNALKDYSKRNDPVYISRVLSAMINCNEDKGVMFGNLYSNYSDGTSPTNWNSSCTILRQWFSTGCQPVKYGQCWVFAAVLCTALRCLGIPARVVTNFNSAHNTKGNLTIDEYYDIDGKMISEANRDSVWNFHVWNEAWMERRDLSPVYNGWQALDPTPQKTNNGIYCCGPAPVKAIKEGDINLHYDCPFIFAEVNADVAKWVVRNKWVTPERLYEDSAKIGKHISTKEVGSNGRMDITNNYKYPEGSQKERLVFSKALKMMNVHYSGNINCFDKKAMSPSKIGVELKFKMKESPVFGQDVELISLLSNLTSSWKRVTININIQAIENNGVHGNVVCQISYTVELKPHTENSRLYLVPYSLYKMHLTDSNLLKVTAVGELSGTKEKLFTERKITLDSPKLHLEIPGKAFLFEPYQVIIKFQNPLNETLYNCRLIAEGNGLVYGFIKERLENLPPGFEFRIKVTVDPYKSGKRMLQLFFTSDKIRCIKQHVEITVLP